MLTVKLAFSRSMPLPRRPLYAFVADVIVHREVSVLVSILTTYVIVHVGTLVFIGLMGVALYLLVRGLPGRAAQISRLAIGPFVLFYAAWESVIGLAIGVLGLAEVALWRVFPDNGRYPFSIWELLGAFVFCGYGIVLCWRSERVRLLRSVFPVYAAACLVAFFVPSAVGDNVLRVRYVAFPIAVLLVLLWLRRGRPLDWAVIASRNRTNQPSSYTCRLVSGHVPNFSPSSPNTTTARGSRSAISAR